MSEILKDKPQDPVDEIRGLIRDIHQTGYSDLDAMQRFLLLYDKHSPDDDFDDFCQQLDDPDIDLEFSENVWEDVAKAYDDLGGSRTALSFPETGRVSSLGWAEELTNLEAIFNSQNITYAQSYALYIRKNAQALAYAEGDGSQFTSLLANPRFLSGLVQVYDYESNYRDTEHIPSSWPNSNDGFLEVVLGAVGYKYVYSFQKDWQFEFDGRIKEGFAVNLQAIARLEAMRPGATRFLSEQFGIRHFSRYPTELLISQFDGGGKVCRPYGVSIGAVHDHNSAFSNYWTPTNSLPGKLYTETYETHDFVVAEAETAKEFEDRIQHFDNANGERFKIDFALIEAHGTADLIKFGTAPDLGSLAISSKLRGVHKIFSPRSCIVLTGCSTGQINGIAQSLSRQFNTTVVAPSVVTSTGKIEFIYGQESIKLIPTYGEKHDFPRAFPIAYRNGEPLGFQKTAEYLKK